MLAGFMRKDGTPSARWLKPVPHEEAWFEYEGRRWATNLHHMISDLSPLPSATMGAPWLKVVETEEEARLLQFEITKSQVAWRIRVVHRDAAIQFIRDAERAKVHGVPHPGMFSATFREILKSGRVVTLNGTLGLAFVFQGEELTAVVMPCTDLFEAEKCNALGEDLHAVD